MTHKRKLLQKDFLNVFDHFTSRPMPKAFKSDKKSPSRELKFHDENVESDSLLPEEMLWVEVINQTYRDLGMAINSLNTAYEYNLRCRNEQHISVRAVAERYKHEILLSRPEHNQDDEIKTLRTFIKDFGDRRLCSITYPEIKEFEKKILHGTTRVDLCQRKMRPVNDIIRKSIARWGYLREINYNFYIHEITAITHTIQSNWMKQICDFLGKPHDKLYKSAYNGIVIFNPYIGKDEKLHGIKDIDSRIFNGSNFTLYDGLGKQTKKRRFEEGKA